ncbi:MAG TPA: NAD(P)H-quinone oxidoreductase [Acidimicrobiia bacterium]|nr:NAD(P)H-quinone oxidoreductase [Acidimicrobiia bacterium]
MRALVISDGGRLDLEDRPVPSPGAGEVLVRVHGAGINRADLLQRAGRYPAPPGAPADIPGLEFAGIVEATGEGVTVPGVGDHVMGIVAGGGQAEYLTTAAAHCARVPAGLDLVTAGGIPEAFITAHDAMVTQGDLLSGHRVLVHAVASGVGTAALQLAPALGAASVAGTSRSKDKLERCVELGLDHPVLAPSGFEPAALAAEITAASGGPIDVSVDLLGGPYLAVDVAAAARKGRIVVVGLIAGARAELDMGTLLAKRLTVRGTVLRSRPDAEKADATHLFEGQVVPLLARGTVRPVIDEVVPIGEAERGYELVAADRTCGKVVLDLR